MSCTVKEKILNPEPLSSGSLSGAGRRKDWPFVPSAWKLGASSKSVFFRHFVVQIFGWMRMLMRAGQVLGISSKWSSKRLLWTVLSLSRHKLNFFSSREGGNIHMFDIAHDECIRFPFVETKQMWKSLATWTYTLQIKLRDIMVNSAAKRIPAQSGPRLLECGLRTMLHLHLLNTNHCKWFCIRNESNRDAGNKTKTRLLNVFATRA